MAEIVIDKHCNTSVLPNKHMELNRDVKIKGNASIDGSLYGNKITFESKTASVKKSIYSNLDIHFNIKKGSKIELNSSVVADRSIGVTADEIALNIRFGGIVKAKICNLKNAIVYGSVIADNCQIENSIVFGSIICKKELKANNSIINSFSAKKVYLGKNVTLFEPYGLAEEVLVLQDPLKSLFLNVSGELSDEILSEDDIATVELYDQHENKTKQKLLSVNGRVLNIKSIKEAQEKVYNKFHSFFDLLKSGEFEALYEDEKKLFGEYIKVSKEKESVK